MFYIICIRNEHYVQKGERAMIELPNTSGLINLIGDTISGRRIVKVIVAQTPHRFVWYYDDPQKYHELLVGKTIEKVSSFRGIVRIKAGTINIVFSDGIELKLHDKNEKSPDNHQLLIEFDGSLLLSASVQIYGALWCFREGEFINPYFGDYSPIL